MNKPKILLSIDGSAQSKQAALLAFELAKKSAGKITAQHVIDSKGARQFVNGETAGFLGEKSYEASCKTILAELGLLARELQTAVRKEASEAGVKLEFVIDEGDPIEHIVNRSTGADLVVIGHRHQPIMPHELYRRQFMRLSVAESLAQDLHKPLLFVQKATKPWKVLTILTVADYLDADYFDSCLELAHKFDMQSRIVCLAPGDEIAAVTAQVEQFKQKVVLRSDATFEVVALDQVATNIGGYLHQNHVLRSDTDFFKDTLVVMPTRQIGGKRHTLLQDSPAMLVRFLPLPSMLLLPEEHFTWKRNHTVKEVVSSI